MSARPNLVKYASRALSSLPSTLARLIYLASLHDSYTGHYMHEGWTEQATREEVHTLLQGMHSEAFVSVLGLGLVPLCRQLKEHFESLGGDVETMARSWFESEAFREMVPAGCSPVDRRLFISQMRAALGVLSRSPDLAALAEPDALPPQPPAQ